MKISKLILLFLSTGVSVFGQEKNSNANELLGFLEGKWQNHSFIISEGIPVKVEEYSETMKIKDLQTLTITAHGFQEGKDLSKDMEFTLNGNEVAMRQGDFVARGEKVGNVYYLRGKHGEKEYRFRLYTLGDKYIFQSEEWEAGKVTNINMSYLVREE